MLSPGYLTPTPQNQIQATSVVISDSYTRSTTCKANCYRDESRNYRVSIYDITPRFGMPIVNSTGTRYSAVLRVTAGPPFSIITETSSLELCLDNVVPYLHANYGVGNNIWGGNPTAQCSTDRSLEFPQAAISLSCLEFATGFIFSDNSGRRICQCTTNHSLFLCAWALTNNLLPGRVHHFNYSLLVTWSTDPSTIWILFVCSNSDKCWSHM
jgi:hypothetical protein